MDTMGPDLEDMISFSEFEELQFGFASKVRIPPSSSLSHGLATACRRAVMCTPAACCYPEACVECGDEWGKVVSVVTAVAGRYDLCIKWNGAASALSWLPSNGYPPIPHKRRLSLGTLNFRTTRS